jgi:hypothetical protein
MFTSPERSRTSSACSIFHTILVGDVENVARYTPGARIAQVECGGGQVCKRLSSAEHSTSRSERRKMNFCDKMPNFPDINLPKIVAKCTICFHCAGGYGCLDSLSSLELRDSIFLELNENFIRCRGQTHISLLDKKDRFERGQGRIISRIRLKSRLSRFPSYPVRMLP